VISHTYLENPSGGSPLGIDHHCGIGRDSDKSRDAGRDDIRIEWFAARRELRWTRKRPVVSSLTFGDRSTLAAPKKLFWNHFVWDISIFCMQPIYTSNSCRLHINNWEYWHTQKTFVLSLVDSHWTHWILVLIPMFQCAFHVAALPRQFKKN